MAEHWKSTPKYWCKHCTIYVKDTAFERKQHESTGKHQGSLRRFLQGIQKDHVKNERDKERTKMEVERLNRITGAVSQPGTGSGTTAVARPSKSTKDAATATLSAADQKRQWAQLAEMGVAVPDRARSDMAIPGEWQNVATRKDVKADPIDDKLNVGIKRKYDAGGSTEESDEVIERKGWGSRVRQYPGHDSNPSNDLDELLAGSLRNRPPTSVKRELSADDKVALQDSDAALPRSSLKIETTDEDKRLPEEVPEKNEPVSDQEKSTPQSDTRNGFRGIEYEDPADEPSMPLFKKKKRKARPLLITPNSPR